MKEVDWMTRLIKIGIRHTTNLVYLPLQREGPHVAGSLTGPF